MNWNKTGIRWRLKVEKRVMGSRKLFIRGWGKKRKNFSVTQITEARVKRARAWERNDDASGRSLGSYVTSTMHSTWASKVKNFLCEMKWETSSIVRSVLGKKTKTKKRKTIKEIIQIFLNTLKWKIENAYESRSSQKLVHLSE